MPMVQMGQILPFTGAKQEISQTKFPNFLRHWYLLATVITSLYHYLSLSLSLYLSIYLALSFSSPLFPLPPLFLRHSFVFYLQLISETI